MTFRKDKFNTVWIAPTYNCNNRCRWCYADSNYNNDRKYISKDHIVPIITLLDNLHIKKVILIGGEPTLYPYINDIFNELSNKNIIFGMVSNGRKLSDLSFAQLIKQEGLEHITISFCGSDSLSHDNLTQVDGSFDQAIQGLRNAHSVGIKVSTNLVINRATINQLETFVNRFESEPVFNMGFNICGPCIENSQNNNYMISPKEGTKAFEHIFHCIKEKGLRSKLVTPMPFCFFSENFRQSAYNQRIISSGPCQLSTSKNFVIDSNLDIVPCTHLTGFPLFNLLNKDKNLISSEEFINNIDSPYGKAFELREKMNRYPSQKCNECRATNCGGGCPLYWMVFNPETEITSPIKD